MKNAFDSLITGLGTVEEKKYLRLRIFQYKPPKLKSKENNDLKKRQTAEYPRTMGQL